MTAVIQVEHKNSITTITLNRPELHNAINEVMIQEISTAIEAAGKAENCRVVVLKAFGKNFSAGADLNWMQQMVNYSYDQNKADARALSDMFEAIAACPKPTVCAIQGAVYGGGVGLVACCDIAIATTKARFCFSETKLGILPGVISPFVIDAIGSRIAKKLFLTAEVFNAQQAQSYNLIHQTVADTELESTVNATCKQLLNNGPHALMAVKELIRNINPLNLEEVKDLSIEAIANIRISPEGQEGLSAFLEKRKAEYQLS